MNYVAPLAGAWIETRWLVTERALWAVAPLAGAWIETNCGDYDYFLTPSLPSRERGLKLLCQPDRLFCQRRSPRGSVD